MQQSRVTKNALYFSVQHFSVILLCSLFHKQRSKCCSCPFLPSCLLNSLTARLSFFPEQSLRLLLVMSQRCVRGHPLLRSNLSASSFWFQPPLGSGWVKTLPHIANRPLAFGSNSQILPWGEGFAMTILASTPLLCGALCNFLLIATENTAFVSLILVAWDFLWVELRQGHVSKQF